jgi:hypothetical protein
MDREVETQWTAGTAVTSVAQRVPSGGPVSSAKFATCQMQTQVAVRLAVSHYITWRLVRSRGGRQRAQGILNGFAKYALSDGKSRGRQPEITVAQGRSWLVRQVPGLSRNDRPPVFL